MQSELQDISEEIKNKVNKRLKKRKNEKQFLPSWYEDEKLNEVEFCREFLSDNILKCINGNFYNLDGYVPDGIIEKQIYSILSKYIHIRVSKIVKQVIETLKLECFSEPLEIRQDEINLLNGTLRIDGKFYRSKQFCLNRLNINYNENIIKPEKWLCFLSELIEKEDILTLQEFMGYCFIPSTRAQKMLVIVGTGGEGKSRIGLVIKEMFGKNMISGSIQRIETDKFARANLENQLLFLDDDIKMEALPQTNYIKTIVTAEAELDIERKGKQSYQSKLYARFLCFGNGMLGSLYDKSDGFFRRQIILTTLPKPKDRKDNPYLADELIKEKESIFYWCFEGLQRLIRNGFVFTQSEKSKRNLDESMEDNCNIISFLKATDWIILNQNSNVTSKVLYEVYQSWCNDNIEKPIVAKTFTTYLKQNAGKYHIQYVNNIKTNSGTKVRGFTGIKVIKNTCNLI